MGGEGCDDCKIPIEAGTIDPTKCAGFPNWMSEDCCNCWVKFMQRTGNGVEKWQSEFNQYACNQCKHRQGPPVTGKACTKSCAACYRSGMSPLAAADLKKHWQYMGYTGTPPKGMFLGGMLCPPGVVDYNGGSASSSKKTAAVKKSPNKKATAVKKAAPKKTAAVKPVIKKPTAVKKPTTKKTDAKKKPAKKPDAKKTAGMTKSTKRSTKKSVT